MNKTRLFYWIATGIIFLFEGVMPALTGHTEMAKAGVAHLGYPDYFRVFLNIMKVAIWFLLIYAVALGYHISATFRYMKQYAALFDEQPKNNQPF